MSPGTRTRRRTAPISGGFTSWPSRPAAFRRPGDSLADGHGQLGGREVTDRGGHGGGLQPEDAARTVESDGVEPGAKDGRRLVDAELERLGREVQGVFG